MKMPNGYGSVYKLSGRRRRPWAARKTVGWKIDEKTGKSFPEYQFIGFYKTKNDALKALAEYNASPDTFSNMTFGEVYDKWSELHYPKIKSPNAYIAAHNICKMLDNKRMSEITLEDLQKTADDSGKHEPVLRVYRHLLNQMFGYSVANGIIPNDRKDMLKYIDITGSGNPKAREKHIFKKEDVQKLWNHESENEYISIFLILIYSGVRINELLNLDKKDLHLKERYFYIKESKTETGIREVPICEKIVPLFQKWLNKKTEFLFTNKSGGKLMYDYFYKFQWKQIINSLNLTVATPHATRHTFITRMTEAGVDERIIKAIVGHKGENVTQIVYTHITLPAKLEAVNRL